MPRPAAKLAVENLSPLELELRNLERRYRGSYKVVSTTPLFYGVDAGPSASSLQQPAPTLPPTVVEFAMQPSDPDFPFDLESLHLRLVVPTHVFQPDTKPLISTLLSGSRIKVVNPEIPPDLARAVESGFRKKMDAHLIHSANVVNGLVPGQVFLGMLNWLDRELEKLLSGLGDADVVGVTGLVVNNARTQQELREAVRERVEAGFNQVESMLPRTDREGGRVFYYGVPREESVQSSDSEGETGSEFNETESTVSKSTKGAVDLDDSPDDESTVPLPLESAVLEIPQHRGTEIRLLHPSLKAISLLECVKPKFLLSCTRCKTHFDSPDNLVPNAVHTTSCRFCDADLSITFRPSLVHAASGTVGYLDLEGYSVLDMLPSAWQVTCEACDKVTASMGVLKSLPRGDVEMRVGCCGCHARMGIMINEIKFVKLMPSVATAAAALSRMALKPKKKKNVDEGIVLGEPLPRNGACTHYRKSYRWFRFPCCGRAFSCDLCHEESKSDGHEMQWANRMICG
ncbi:hypothetical protein HDU98_005341, partial [Podochytrium sp. JEL0797]